MRKRGVSCITMFKEKCLEIAEITSLIGTLPLLQLDLCSTHTDSKKRISGP